jgi:SEC-C motif-containing protein
MICPCGSGLEYAACCEPYITGAKDAPTAEALMRSRYSAYAVHNVDYIVRTCEGGGAVDGGAGEKIDLKQTRDWSEKSTWLGLQIISVSGGGPADTEGAVEFEATYERDRLKDVHHEKARFKKKDGIWYYEDGDIVPKTVVRAGPKVGRNEPCPCGSGKKYKHCHGR